MGVDFTQAMLQVGARRHRHRRLLLAAADALSLPFQEGVFDQAVEAIREAKARGFQVTTNTTVFLGENPKELRKMFDFMSDLGIDGMMISPGYSYEKAPDQDHFLKREQTKALFREILEDRGRWNFNHSPQFLDFLEGKKEYECTPWGNPTRNVFGWQRPCYLLQDGYAKTFRELEGLWAEDG